MLGLVIKKEIDKGTLSQIWDYFTQMSADKTTEHEYNKGELGSFPHSDGWGISWLVNGKISSYHSLAPVMDSSLPDEVIDNLLDCTAFVLHTRKASPGIPYGLEYCHPFIRSSSMGEIALAHNGTIQESSKLSFSIEPETDSDTERLILHLIKKVEQSEVDTKSAIFNSMIELDGYSGANILVLHSSFFSGMTNFTKNPNYLTMQYAETMEFVAVASEEVPPISDKWSPLNNHEMIWCDIETQKTEILKN